MPKYQMIFDTHSGEKSFNVAVDDDEALAEVETDLLNDLEEKGLYLRGAREGSGKVVYKCDGRELDRGAPLPEQRVRPNDIIRVGVKAPALQIRRDDQVFDVTRRESLREGDDLIVGRTILRFHVRRQQKLLNQSATFIQRMQQGRSFQQTVYYMGLVGAMAGLACWFFLSLLELAQIALSARWQDLIIFSLLGGFIGGLTVGFSDHWLGDRATPRWTLMGIVVGAAAGAAGGLPSSFIRAALDDRSPLAGRMLGWMLAGALIGFGVSLRWFSTNKYRVAHGLLGGLFGGLLGGLVYWLLAGFAGGDISQALGLMLTGAGITCGICLAPILLRRAALEFVNSRDPAAIKKYAASRKQWDIHEGGRYIVGSLGAKETNTLMGSEVQIFIPDQFVAPRHAILTVKEKQYFIEPHPELY